MAARLLGCLLLVGATLLVGCRTVPQAPDPEYSQVIHSIDQAWQSPNPAHDAVNPVISHLEGPHSLDEYIRFALEQNPDIQAARKRMEAFAHLVPVAASLPDPTLQLTVQPEPVQTAAGQQELILSASQKIHWRGKLDTRASIAETQTDVARAQLVAAEQAAIAKVKRAYYELYFIQNAIAITKEQQISLGQIRDVANKRSVASLTSHQDLLRADLEVSKVEDDLIRLRQELASGQARLARVLHIAPQSKVLPLDRLPPQQSLRDLESLQQLAVAARPELQAQLAAIERDQQAVELARYDYKPDMTLGFSWIDVSNAGVSPVTNGRDAFLLTAGINLPVYRKRLNSSVRSAEARAVASARQYDSMRDGTLEEVTDLFAQVKSQQDLLTLYREDILTKARHTFEFSLRAYDVGEVDFLLLIDNWRELLRYELRLRRLEASLGQSLAELERVVGGFIEEK